jgi:hypothetical protein
MMAMIYHWDKFRDKALLWIARNLFPERLKMWIYICYGGARIQDDEIVPDVKFTDLLGREPRAKK